MGKNTKYIVIPASIEIPAEEGVDASIVSFTDALQKVWLNDARFAGSTENGMHGYRVLEAFESAPWELKSPGDIVELHESDWKVLCAAIQTPSPSSPVLSANIWRRAKRVGWFDSVLLAKDTDPCQPNS